MLNSRSIPLFLLAGILWLGACAPTQTGSTLAPTELAPPDQAPPPQVVDRDPALALASPGPSSRAVSDDVYLTLTSDKYSYQPGEKIRVTVVLENQSQRIAPYWVPNSGDPAVTVTTRIPGLETTVELSETDIPRVKRAVQEKRNLDPKQRLTRPVFWDQFLPGDENRRLRAPSGKYTIVAAFNRGTPDGGLPPLVARLDIELAGSQQVLISKEKARDVAMRVPAVEKWLRDHSWAGLVYNDGTKYYLASDEGQPEAVQRSDGYWLSISAEQAEAYRSETPQESSVFSSEGWSFRFSSRLGRAPHWIEVVIEPQTGTVKIVRTEQ